ncbi:unnamed protein product [Effrenium voratum]|uniref:Calponin-homology (CH) domain-containing protein n=1 Tax=Effrenium voratum TaxID=2562239 RepID=A0AA36JCC1_9DINO|nr:unnamed protein product [Effrenium voratum]
MKDDAAQIRELVAAGVDVLGARNKSKMFAMDLARERGKQAALACLEELAKPEASATYATSIEPPKTSTPATADEASAARGWKATNADAKQLAIPPTKTLKGVTHSSVAAKAEDTQSAKPGRSSAVDFAACDFRTLPAQSWQRLHEAFRATSVSAKAEDTQSAKPGRSSALTLLLATSARCQPNLGNACMKRSGLRPCQPKQRTHSPQNLAEAPQLTLLLATSARCQPNLGNGCMKRSGLRPCQPKQRTHSPQNLAEAPQLTLLLATSARCQPNLGNACMKPFRATSVSAKAEDAQLSAAQDSIASGQPGATGPSISPPFQAPSRVQVDEIDEESEESEEETDDEVETHASPDLGLRRASTPTEPWRPALAWLCAVVNERLQAPPPPSQARQIRGLLPVGALDAEKLSIRDLCDGQLLCALVISVRPDVLPKANPVALGRIAQFLKACTALGVNKVSLFSPPDLTPEPSNPNAVLRCLQALAATLQASQSWTGPRLEGLPGRR